MYEMKEDLKNTQVNSWIEFFMNEIKVDLIVNVFTKNLTALHLNYAWVAFVSDIYIFIKTDSCHKVIIILYG